MAEARTARKWLESIGAPLCRIEGHGPMRHDPLGADEDDVEPRWPLPQYFADVYTSISLYP